MQAKTIIDKFDALYRNDIPFEVKIDWLRELDQKMFLDIVATHEGAPDIYAGIDDEGDNDLIAEPPYDALYIAYLRNRLDEVTNETARYINSMQIFNDKLADFAKAYNRAHMPLERGHLKFY